MSLKESWKRVGGDVRKIGENLKESNVKGDDFEELGKDLGVSVIKSVKKGVDIADRWAEQNDKDRDASDDKN